MRIITEIELRAQFKTEKFDSFILNKDERLTPAASQFLSERSIRINRSESSKNDSLSGKAKKSALKKVDLQNVKVPEEGYICLPSGKIVMEKPEHFTHLKGRILVTKNDPIIKFRGQLDLLEAEYICCINQIGFCGYKKVEEDLTKIFEYLQKIMRAEVLDEPLPFIEFNEWSDADIREYSHYPDKHFGVKHILPNPSYGQIYGYLNKIRAMVRQLEVTAVEAFYNPEEDISEKNDILLALNRLSSLLYIIICKLVGGHY